MRPERASKTAWLISLPGWNGPLSSHLLRSALVKKNKPFLVPARSRVEDFIGAFQTKSHLHGDHFSARERRRGRCDCQSENGKPRNFRRLLFASNCHVSFESNRCRPHDD